MSKLSLLAVYAHPDDEAYGSAGTFAKYAREGVATALISATRGEAGEISDATLATSENLAAVREAELRRACAIVGVRDVRFLDCPDGGVAMCSRELAIGKIVAAIRERKPQVVLTFGPEGIYGHPDHIAVHEMTLIACDLASDSRAYPEQLSGGLEVHTASKVYFRVIPKSYLPQLGELFQQIRTSLGIHGNIEDCFLPDEDVTTKIDVGAFVNLKRQAIAAHRTQMDGDPFSEMPAHEVKAQLGDEHYQLRGTRRGPTQPFEADLFAGLS